MEWIEQGRIEGMVQSDTEWIERKKMIKIVEKFEWEGSTKLNRLVETVGAGCEEKLCNPHS